MKKTRKATKIKSYSYADQCLDLAALAKPGPWEPEIRLDDYGLGCIINRHSCGPIYEKGGKISAARDAFFIAGARTMVPELANRLKEACEALKCMNNVVLALRLEEPLK